MRAAEMNFDFGETFQNTRMPEAYERLLLDAMNGDASLFARSDEIVLAWKLIDGIRRGWDGDAAPPLRSYEAGSWGPRSAEQLLGRDGRWWVHDTGSHQGGERGGHTS